MAQKFFDIVKLNDVYYGEITGEQSIIAKGKIGSHDFASKDLDHEVSFDYNDVLHCDDIVHSI